jgi:hypothetical protein
VNTLLFFSPTGSPLEDVTPSTGGRLSLGWHEEKKSDPNDNGNAELLIGDMRVAAMSKEGSGTDKTCSYMSLNRSKSVGKKMSKYPG